MQSLRVKEYECRHPTAGPLTDLACKCKKCPSFTPQKGDGQITPTRIIRFDHHNLAPGKPGIRFNPSIIESGDGYLFSWRHGWGDCQIWLMRLDKDFTPVGEAKALNLTHKMAKTQEDARLFRFRGRLHVSYTGFYGGYYTTSTLYARLNEETLTVEENFYPHYPRRQRDYEKNWSYYEHAGKLYAVYMIKPHRILRIDGDKATPVIQTPVSDKWTGNLMRGGASPVLHNGVWTHFFHSYEWVGGKRRYSVGVYEFANKHPFRMLRLTPNPIQVAPRASDCPSNCFGVIFPGGVVRLGNQWVLANGINDRHSELHFLDAAEIDRRLVPV